MILIHVVGGEMLIVCKVWVPVDLSGLYVMEFLDGSLQN